MNGSMEYRADLLESDGANICGSTTFLASSNKEAVEKAKQWATSLRRSAADVWLQINLNGVGIRTLRQDEF